MKTRNYISNIKVSKITLAIMAFLFVAFTGNAQSITTSFSATKPSGSITQSISPDIKIYPNPADEYVLISFSSKVDSKAEIMFYDLKGSLILNEAVLVKAGYNNFKFATGKYPSGTYIVVVKTSIETFKEKLLINH